MRKGQHGTKVYFVKQLQVKDGDGEGAESRLVPMMREYTVFNVDQCEGLLRARTHEMVNEVRIEHGLPALPRRRDLTDVEIKALVDERNAEEAAAAAASTNPTTPDMTVSREAGPVPKTTTLLSYRPRRGQPVDIARLQLGQLLRLLRRRDLHPLPDDDQSRRWLQAARPAMSIASSRARSRPTCRCRR